MPKRDINQIAASIVQRSTTPAVSVFTLGAAAPKNPAAVALGRLGGLKGGKARAESLTAARRKKIAQKAAKTRWKKAKPKK